MGRTRRGCEACRESHSKCDKATPACHRCSKRGIECVQKNPIRFVPSKESRWERQTSGHREHTELSATPPATLQILEAPKSLEICLVEQSPAVSNPAGDVSSATLTAAYDRDARDDSAARSPLQNGLAISGSQPISDLSRDPYSLSPAYSSSSNQGWFPWKSLPPPTWLSDEREVHILKHYIDILAVWIDFCDVERTFGVVVPRLAALHSPLLNAILAVSSKHLSILTGQNGLAAGRYYQDCLGALIPLLNDESAVTNDMILAVIVLLRLIEELESPNVQATSPGHMQGIRECVRAQGQIAAQSRLRYTSLCVMVRQENYLAIMNMCPIGWDLDAFTIPRDPESSDELSWTMLIVRLCADLVQFSNDERSKQGLEQWQYLKSLNEQWNLTKPRSFEAMFTKDADRARGEPFPKSWFLQVWHSTSAQHYHLNRILLAASDPHVPRFGPAHQDAYRKAEREILTHMRHICGIALVHADQQPCMVTAYMAISTCGDRFTDRLEQEGMLELLTTVNKQFGWPTRTLQDQLKTSWGYK